MRTHLLITADLFWNLSTHAAETTNAPDISGTWIVKRNTPMGDMETVYEFKVHDGKVEGSVSGPFGDMPINRSRRTARNVPRRCPGTESCCCA